MAMSRDKNAGGSHVIKIDNSSFGKVEEFKGLGTTLKKFSSGRNYEQIEVSECLLSYGAQFFVFQFAIKKLKTKIYRNLILPIVLYGCETWSLTLREKRRLKMFKNSVLMRIFGPKTCEVKWKRRKLHN